MNRLNVAYYLALAGAGFSVPFIINGGGIIWTILGVWNAILVILILAYKRKMKR